jgi:hypothetical protein
MKKLQRHFQHLDSVHLHNYLIVFLERPPDANRCHNSFLFFSYFELFLISRLSQQTFDSFAFVIEIQRQQKAKLAYFSLSARNKRLNAKKALTILKLNEMERRREEKGKEEILI